MFHRFVQKLWGNFESREEIKKFSLLALTFGLIIGTYWTLRPMKDGIFSAIVGVDYIPKAKILSLFVIIPLVILYGKLIDIFPRHKVFYVLATFYGLAFLIFSFLFFHPEIGLPNTLEDPSRIIGWAWYVFIESFGSLIVALFWAFTTDITDPDSAKRGFPLIAMFGQIGNILGPFLLTPLSKKFGTSAPVVGICGVLILCIALMIWLFMTVIPQQQLKGFKGEAQAEKESKPGFIQGLKLLVTQPYLLGIFSVITIYEIVVTILDFHFKASVKAQYPLEADMTAYLGNYAVWTGIIATTSIILGINNIQRRLGMTASLISLPLLVAIAVVTLKVNPVLSVAFWIMVFSKAVNYALNQPTLKQLYIPTTKDTKYKSQAWIEMFGSRGSKAMGSTINNFRALLKTKHGALAGTSMFLTMSTTMSLGLIVGWLFITLFVSKTYNKAVTENRIVC